MKVGRTRRLTTERAKEILQLRYGSQVDIVTRAKGVFIADSILGREAELSRYDVLKIEDDVFNSMGV